MSLKKNISTFLVSRKVVKLKLHRSSNLHSKFPALVDFNIFGFGYFNHIKKSLID